VIEGQRTPGSVIFHEYSVSDPENSTEYHLLVSIVDPHAGDAIGWDSIGLADSSIAASADGFSASTSPGSPVASGDITEVLTGFHFSTMASYSSLNRIVTLTVTDMAFGAVDGVAVSTNATIEINPVNQAPTVTLGRDRVVFDEGIRRAVGLFIDIALDDVDDIIASAVVTLENSKVGDALVEVGASSDLDIDVSSDGLSVTMSAMPLGDLSTALQRLGFYSYADYV